MALQNTDILLKAQRQALEGAKFKKWGTFAWDEVKGDVEAMTQTLVERD